MFSVMGPGHSGRPPDATTIRTGTAPCHRALLIVSVKDENMKVKLGPTGS